MFRKLRDFVSELAPVLGVLALFVGGVIGAIWYAMLPTTYDLGKGARLVVPPGAVSVDHRDNGDGVAVQSGVNVIVHNESDQWLTLIVSYRKHNFDGILDNHAWEDLPPKSSKRFGTESRYAGMHVAVSDFAQKERDKAAAK